MTVLPRVGFPFARLGESRSEHRSRLGEFDSWRRDLQGTNETDLYLLSLVSLDYDEHDRLTFIEVVDDEAEVHFDGVSLLNRPVAQVLAQMSARGHEPVGPVVGIYAYPELGIRMSEDYDPDIDGYAFKSVGLVAEETNPPLHQVGADAKTFRKASVTHCELQHLIEVSIYFTMISPLCLFWSTAMACHGGMQGNRSP